MKKNNSSTVSDFLFSCFNPVLIRNRFGHEVEVPCNKCISCRQSYMDYLRNNCELEVQGCKYVYKLDLTYDEFNVPFCSILPGNNSGAFKVFHLVDKTIKNKRRYNINTGKYESYKEKSDTFDNIIDTIYVYNDKKELDLFEDFILQSQSQSKFFKRSIPVIRYCKASDLQDFLKRLRKNISKYSDAKFRYFAVSEYGPTTFRPHFHLILFFTDGELLRTTSKNDSFRFVKECRNRSTKLREITLLEKCINDSWQYGDYVFELCRSHRTVAEYVTSYATSATHLPKYLRGKNIRPRAFHSSYLGCQAIREVRDYFYSNFNSFTFDQVNLSLSSGIFSFRFTKNLQNKIFPRSYGFGEYDRKQLYELYTIYSRIPKKIREKYKLSRIVYYIIHRPVKYARFLKLLDIPICDITEVHLNRIYRQLLISRYFLKFCCEIYPPCYVIDVFINFRLALFSNLMKHMYEAQDEYYKETGCNDFSLFYSKEGLKESSYKRLYEKQRILKYNERVKHKVLNDLNKKYV